MSKLDYFEKLKDPRWQKKRLKIFERDKYMCRFCYDETKTLTVHHTYYQFKKDPWNYADESLITLCDDCHNELTESIEETKTLFSTIQTMGDSETYYLYVDIIKSILIRNYDISKLIKLFKLIKNFK